MMIIRELEATDLKDLLTLYQHLHRSDVPLPDAQIVNDKWLEILESSYFRYFGGFIDSTLIASCTLTMIPNLTRGCRPYGVIENVVTHADFRNRGYGKKMLAHALAWAWSHDCYKVMLMTGKKDEATFQFYESAGFDRHAKQGFVAANPH